MSDLILPFKPFTYGEIQSITGVPAKVMDVYIGHRLPLETGEDGVTQGLGWMAAFALFCGYRWLKEGADSDRAGTVVSFIAQYHQQDLERNILRGLTFPVPQAKTFVKPPKNRIGNTLNMAVLYKEFLYGVHRTFGTLGSKVDTPPTSTEPEPEIKT